MTVEELLKSNHCARVMSVMFIWDSTPVSSYQRFSEKEPFLRCGIDQKQKMSPNLLNAEIFSFSLERNGRVLCIEL